ATGSSYVASVAATYKVIVTQGTCTGTSAVTTVNVNTLPVPTIVTSSGPATFCSNSGIYLTTSTTGYNYSWFKGSTLLSGETGQNYIPSASGTYKVQITDGIGCT